jgi:hypothetical protein
MKEEQIKELELLNKDLLKEILEQNKKLIEINLQIATAITHPPMMIKSGK